MYDQFIYKTIKIRTFLHSNQCVSVSHGTNIIYSSSMVCPSNTIMQQYIVCKHPDTSINLFWNGFIVYG